MTRETWATRLGFILAAVGSTVGLGNIWRFPWQTTGNGGSAFLIVYLDVVLLVGVPGLFSEFVTNRHTGKSPVGTLRGLSGSREWGIVDASSVVTGISLLSFYSAVGGWTVRYLLGSAAALAGDNPAYFTSPGQYFGGVSTGIDAALYHLPFLGLTALIVFTGVRKGIELGTKAMMSAVLVLLIGLTGWAATQSNAAAGYASFLRFDPSVITENLFVIFGPAAGQALFTLSLGADTVITYSLYLRKDRLLSFDGSAITVFNTSVGAITGLIIFPFLFSQGINPTGTGTGPGALFVGLAGAFLQLPAGTLIATAFFGVVTLAALSSSISMLEIPVAFLVDEYGISHRHTVSEMTTFAAATGGVCAFNPDIFGSVAGPLVSVLLTAGLAAFSLFVGWVMGREALEESVAGADRFSKSLGTPWLFVVDVVLSLFLVFTLLTHFGVDTTIGFWPAVGVAVVASAVAFLSLRQPNSVA